MQIIREHVALDDRLSVRRRTVFDKQEDAVRIVFEKVIGGRECAPSGEQAILGVADECIAGNRVRADARDVDFHAVEALAIAAQVHAVAGYPVAYDWWSSCRSAVLRRQ